MSGSLPQLDIATYGSQLFWLIISFSILYFAISRFFLPNIKLIIEKRADYISNNSIATEAVNNDIIQIDAKYNMIKLENNKKISDVIAHANGKAEEITANGNLSIAQNLKDLQNQLKSDVKNNLEASRDILHENALNISDILFGKFFSEKIDENQSKNLDLLFEKYWMKEKNEVK